MSLSNENNRNDYVGNDSVSVYSYTFKILNSSHIAITVRDTSDVETTLVETTDYTVSDVLNPAGGSITLVDAGQSWLTTGNLTTGYVITFIRNVPVTQETDIRNQGDFYAETHEDAFDYSRMVDQQQQEEIDRAVKSPVSLPLADFDPTLPADLATADMVISVNSTADGFTVGPSVADISAASSNATAAAASAAAAAASAIDADNASSGNMTVDNFNGDGSTVLFTLSLAPGSENNTDVYISGVYQQKDTYTVLSTALTFSVAPPVGTGNIEVMIGSTLSLSAPADASVNTATIVDGAVTSSKIADGARALRKMISKTAAYTLLTDDDFLFVDASSGGVTITVPTFSDGKVFTVQKIDSSFNTVSVGGVAVLSTLGDQVTIMDKGAPDGYVSIDRVIPKARSTFTMAITAAANPSIATTPDNNLAYWYRDDHNMIVDYFYSHSSSTGTALGTGTYNYGMPSGVTIDSSFVNIGSPVYGALGRAEAHTNADLSLQGHIWAPTNTTLSLYVRTYNGVIGDIGGSGSTYAGLTDITYNLHFNAIVPITGWEG